MLLRNTHIEAMLNSYYMVSLEICEVRPQDQCRRRFATVSLTARTSADDGIYSFRATGAKSEEE